MNIANLLHSGITARLFAGITIVSLLMSAFPVAFFVANAANTDAVGDVTLEVSPTSNPGEQATVSFAGTGTLNLNGWSLWDIEASERNVFTFGAETLTNGQSFTICNDVACDGLISGGSTVFNDGGDTTELRDEGGNVVVAVTWPSVGATDLFSNTEAVDYAPAGPVENTDTGETFVTVQEAIDDTDTDNGDTIVMSANETILQRINIDKEITLNGGGFTVDAAFTKADIVSTNDNNAAITITGTNNVKVENIVLDGANGTDLHGINVYESTGITVENVTSKNFRSGMVVNGSTVDASDFSTEGNIWHGINVAPGKNVTSDSILNISNTSSHGEVAPVAHIFTDNINAGSVIEVNDLDDQYDFFDFPEAVALSVGNELVAPQGNVARAYFLKTEDEFEPLKLTAICTLDDEEGMRFRVQNTNPFPITATYEVVGTTDTGTVEIAAAGAGVIKFEGATDGADYTFFDTAVVTDAGTTKLFYSYESEDYETVKASNKTECPKPPRPVDQCFDANLLVNGSFEEPVVKNKSQWQKMSSVPGWTTTKVSDDSETTLELMRGIFGNEAAEGEQYAELDGDHSTKVTQSVATLARGTYELKWAFAGRHNAGGDIQNQLDVLVNGSSVATEGPQTDPAGLDYDVWTEGSYTFMATSDQTEIAFADLGPSNSFGTYLDNARLCLVEEPEPEPQVCSFAGEVVTITENPLKFDGSPVDTDRRTLTSLDSVAPYINFFGKEGNGWSTSDFLSLGVEGTVTYKFTDKVAIDGPGSDIAIWEVTGGDASQQTNAKAIVEVSQNGTDFYNLGTITGDGAVDIAPSGFTFVQYVRVTDDSRSIGNDDGGDGYDIDAITIIDGSCDDYVTVNTSKIVCDYEDELPDWGAGSANITAATASQWLAANDHTSCRLVDGWEFEWAKSSASNPGNSYVGYGGSNWNTFTTQTAVPLSLVDGKSFWMREVLQDGYIGFGGANKKADISAEMYCHKDVLNYDNFDRVDNPKAGDEYHCVAWNVPKVPPQCELDIYSDTSTVVLDTNGQAVETYDGNKRWTANIPGAIWVWITEQVTDPEEDETVTFVETFTVDNPTLGNITIAYDNWLTLDVNGTEFVRNQNGYQDFQKFEQDILSALVSGQNRIEMTVTNLGTDRSNYRSNPAGTLFHIEVEGDPKSCARTTEPVPPATLTITNPATPGLVLSGSYDFTADYFDNDPVADDFGWAIRSDEMCDDNSKTVAGNAIGSGFSDPFTYDINTGLFTANVDLSTLPDGDYCLVVNPREGEGEENLRATTTFTVLSPVVDPQTYRISGFKWDDANGNGLFDDSEVPADRERTVAGWEIFLTQGDTTISTTTDDTGAYYFDVLAGDWTITEETVEGWTQTGQYLNSEPVAFDGDMFGACTFTVPDSNNQSAFYTCSFGNQQNEVQVPSEGETDTSISRSGEGGGGATRIRQVTAPTPLVLGATTDAPQYCPFLLDYMQMGTENDTVEVMKLQMFLNIFRSLYGGTENPVTGNFGTITDANVKKFQEFYKDDILQPWFDEGIVGHTKPTGFVYKTTLWKINSIVCPDTAVLPDLTGETLQTNVDLNARAIQD